MDFSFYNGDYLEKALSNRVIATGLSSIDAYLEYVHQDKTELHILQKALNNNFSEFFRNRFNFNYLEHVILPELIKQKIGQGKKEIRIWSAACAAGQEAYSIAIICNEIGQLINSKINFRIFATDISETEIEKAKIGVYTENDLSNVTLKRLKDNLTKAGDKYKINNELKKYIEFSTFDLLDTSALSPASSIFGNFDVVLCCNLLFYYNEISRKLIVDKITNSLEKKGFLFVDEAETGIIETTYNYINVLNTSVFKKGK